MITSVTLHLYISYMSNRCELFPIELYIKPKCNQFYQKSPISFFLEEIKVQRIICQSTLYCIRDRIIYAHIAGNGGLFHHVSNNTLIRSTNIPNVIENSKTRYTLV